MSQVMTCLEMFMNKMELDVGFKVTPSVQEPLNGFPEV